MAHDHSYLVDFTAPWTACPQEAAADVLEVLALLHPRAFRGCVAIDGRIASLPFYPTFQLVQLNLQDGKHRRYAYALCGKEGMFWLNGAHAAIHLANKACNLKLGISDVPGYLRFFCYFVRDDDRQAFRLLETADDLRPAEFSDRPRSPSAPASPRAEYEEEVLARLEKARAGIAPLTATAASTGEHYQVQAGVAYQDAKYDATFIVSSVGGVIMTEDNPIAELAGIASPNYPPLTVPDPASAEPKEVESTESDDSDAPDDRERRKVVFRSAARSAGSDREVNKAVVGALLDEALAALDVEHSLHRHFKFGAAGARPIEDLAALLHEAGATVIIESEIPFVEDFVADLLVDADEQLRKRSRERASTSVHDDTKCELSVHESRASIYLLSFQVHRSIGNAERVAHELGMADALVLIGTDRVQDVPEPLRRMRDIVIRLPRLNRRTFARVFERVMSELPPAGWDSAMTDWTRYVLPSDFHSARRLRWSASESLGFLKDRVARRLKDVSADSGPSLRDLSGLGEAAQVASDLIADIQAAQAGSIPWTAVDRGLLLAGRPGTGKTTLARAIAKECGIKFVVASASAWQSSGHLGDHLRAMRSDFVEARRYAPAILFIDEIDSIGTREGFGGENGQYHVQVVNALLENIQGFDVGAPVIVIGATNLPSNVDAALKRAGRLDQVLTIPLPNIDGLTGIFEYYLKPLAAGGQLAADVNARQAAGLALGRTGADVEFYVRGAHRRARKSGRLMSQADLLAEITHVPRREDSVRRLVPAELQRVAVHEAGHTTAYLLGARGGTELTYVTIMPRLDGSLGFVASLPPEGEMATRRRVHEEMEVMLAGRAAEEIVFGSADVSLGAGGASEASDLARATHLATVLVCQSGLGGDGDLHWTRTPTMAQEKQIRKLLGERYAAIIRRLRDHRQLLDEVTRLLMEHQEITGEQLRALTGSLRGGFKARKSRGRARGRGA